uniref:Receptor-type tyrosine-protein phosphatase N2-like n=1 Tax=Sparus aurata TaxID=8175 RepID=A0A671Z215_SPAAU
SFTDVERFLRCGGNGAFMHSVHSWAQMVEQTLVIILFIEHSDMHIYVFPEKKKQKKKGKKGPISCVRCESAALCLLKPLTSRRTNNNRNTLLTLFYLLFFFFFFRQGSQINQIPTKYSQAESTKFLILTVVSILCIVGVLLASTVVYCLRHRSHHKLKEKLTNLGTDATSDATATYQELCRQRMAVKPPTERPEPISSRINSVSSQFSDGGQAVSPSARSSISSWSEEPAHSNMDISTGHMILSYMEDHLKNKDRLEKEWEALCAYQAEPNACTVGMKDGNAKKNRSTAVVAYDHSRITLKVENSQGNSDYINASPIMDHDPRNPAYIATQGPLPSTVADFWQMVWENGCVVIVMLTPLVESGVKQCYHYWPDEGSNLYHIYEVNLVSEHIWCDDFLVRSFYLKNMQTNETRTVTQFHFLTWLNQNVPETSRTLLDFRRKVNKCYRGRSCPIIVHCSDGSGRSGTYILVDMVLNKMAKGAKEIDIAATLEHLRDQRPGMVQTKDQFEFALTAVAEEVNAILKALPQ